jgi:hypothetical protein
MTLNDILETDQAIVYHDEEGLMLTINRNHFKAYFREEVIQNGNKEFDYEFVLGYRIDQYIDKKAQHLSIGVIKKGAKLLAEDIHNNKAAL